MLLVIDFLTCACIWTSYLSGAFLLWTENTNRIFIWFHHFLYNSKRCFLFVCVNSIPFNKFKFSQKLINIYYVYHAVLIILFYPNFHSYIILFSVYPFPFYHIDKILFLLIFHVSHDIFNTIFNIILFFWYLTLQKTINIYGI